MCFEILSVRGDIICICVWLYTDKFLPLKLPPVKLTRAPFSLFFRAHSESAEAT